MDEATGKALNSEVNSEQLAAINFEWDTTADVPEWVMLLPPGPEIKGRDGRTWLLPDPQEAVNAFHAGNIDLPFDIEHSTELKGRNGEPAPAVGWIKGMEVRDAAVWGRVEWTDDGRTQIGKKAYRYVSPVFLFEKQSNRITRLLSAGLTNQPNLGLPALNRQQKPQEEQTMWKKMCAKLGLAETATEDEAINAVVKLQSDLAVAVNRAEVPSLDKFVPRSDYDQAVARATNAEQQIADHLTLQREAAINSEIDAAMKEGKIAPASKDFYLASCRHEGGLEQFKKFIATAPVIGDRSGLDDRERGQEVAALNAEQKKIADMFGNSAEEIKKYGMA